MVPGTRHRESAFACIFDRMQRLFVTGDDDLDSPSVSYFPDSDRSIERTRHDEIAFTVPSDGGDCSVVRSQRLNDLHRLSIHDEDRAGFRRNGEESTIQRPTRFCNPARMEVDLMKLDDVAHS